MSPTVRNILAVVAGAFVGSAVNMGIIQIGPAIIPLPAGVDMSTPEGLKAAMPLLEGRHFISPFLAHALGTLAGAWLAAKLGATHQMRLAFGIGLLFLLGGIASVFMIPAPGWFIALDLVVAYLPMAYVGGRLAGTK